MGKIITFYKKYREAILYWFYAFWTFVIGNGFYILFYRLGINEHISNVVSWILAVAFAFVTSKVRVYKTTGTSLIKEIIEFTSSRVFTLLLEEVNLLIFCTWLKFDGVIVKLAATMITILLNWIFTVFIFKEKKDSKESKNEEILPAE